MAKMVEPFMHPQKGVPRVWRAARAEIPPMEKSLTKEKVEKATTGGPSGIYARSRNPASKAAIPAISPGPTCPSS